MSKIRLVQGLFMLLCVLLFSFSYAQEKVITGVITDENGAVLPNATVSVKDGKGNVTTDANGRFRLSVPSGAKTITVSYVGMDSQEISVDGKTTVMVSLKQSDSKLNEVVVVGYGTRRRAEVSSAISSVSAKELKDLPVTGVDQALQGKVAGVTITNNSGQPGGGVSIRVRGITSINSNDPLIVIDGVIFPSNTISNTGYAGLGGANGQTGNSVMATLNPNDIESIDVLKDASAQAIYGSQAANGVIIITTKKGKIGDGKINYDIYFGDQRVTKKLDLMNLREFAQYQNEVAPLLGRTPTEEFKDPTVLGEGTDWQDAIFRTGKTQSHQLSFSGGQNKTNYYLSLNYLDQTGILLGSDFKRYTTRFNLDHQLKNWLKVGVSSNLTRSTQNVTLADAAEGTIWWAAVQNPLIPVKNLNGSWGGGQAISGYQYGQDNPVATSQNRGNKTTNSQIFGSIYADLQLLKGLSLRNEVAYSIGLQNNLAFQNAANIGPRTIQSQMFDGRNNSYYYAIRNYFNYNKTFNKHSISATAGHEAQKSYWEGISGKKVDLQNNIRDLNAGNSDKTTWELNGGKGDWAMESYFVRGNYTYDNRYAFSVSYRADGSSNFGPNNKWGYFPGASLGWTVTNEKFAEGLKGAFSYLKARVGYGAVGNQNLPSGAQNPPYTAGVNFWPGPVGFGQVGSASTNFINGIANPDLSWEAVVTKNAGIDAGLLKGKLELTVDLYKKTTTKMLLFSTGPALIGVGDQWNELKAPIGNVGQMTNSGVDVSLTSYNISKSDFSWKTNLIFSHYKNKLDKLINEASTIDGKVYYDNYTITHTVPGHPVGSFYGLVTDGLFRTQDDLNKSLPQFGYTVDETHTWLGDIRFKDINGDNLIDAKDITFIGNPLPKFTYGLTNTFTYKNLDASIFLQGSYGADIFNFMRWQLEKMDNPYYNQLKTVTNRYTVTNTGGDLPRFTNSNTNNVYISDRYVEDGSYLRIQNVTIGYRLPARLATKAMMSNLRLYASIQNLHTFTNYSGYDPEVGMFNSSIRLMNVDMGHYPVPRTITIGANVEF
jgi:TonB-dependent starch-binding outer membrane protein SusC